MNQSYAVYNPKNKPVEKLPTIYGFNNSKDGGEHDSWQGVLISQDGVILGTHVCSNENYMLSDLGILKNTAPARHEKFKKHYPNGYKMAFVEGERCPVQKRLLEALKLNREKKDGSN